MQKDTLIHRFRGNIIISDCEAFEETQWKHIYIGKNSFVVCFERRIEIKIYN